MTRAHGEGVGFNRFHTTAIVDRPARCCWRVGTITGSEMGRLLISRTTGMAVRGQIPRSSALGAEVMKNYGYSTAAFGKWHNTPAIKTTNAGGGVQNWPSEIGFKYFYGFLAGEASQYEPNLVGRPAAFTGRTM